MTEKQADSDSFSQFFSMEENLNACLTVALKELEDRFADYPAMREPWHGLKAFLRKPGKRVRPMLFLFSYQLFDDRTEVPPIAAFRVAAALEIFHAFALIHDDIIDASHSRRGAPTLHKRLESQVGLQERDSENMALVLGDILFGFAMEGFLHHGFEPQRATRAMRLFLGVAQDTGLGQAVEIAHLSESMGSVSEDEILRTYFLKTTRYTIECPLLLGAILSGAGISIEKALANFAHPLGLAFQIENDLHEVSQMVEGDHGLAYDIHTGVKTLFLKRLHTRLPLGERQEMDALLKEGEAAELADLVQSSTAKGIAAELREEVAKYFDDARHALRSRALSKQQCSSLLSFAEFINLNSHHSEGARREASA